MRESVASLARRLGVSWHAANKLAARHGVEPALPKAQDSLAGDIRVNAELPEIPRKVLLITDRHYPYQDDYAIGAALNFAHDWRPDRVVDLGDVWDFYQISRWDTDPARAKRVQEELDAARPHNAALDQLGVPVDILEGNHDNRIVQLINKNPALEGLRALRMEAMAEIPESFRWHRSQTHLKVGDLYLMHGDLKGGPRTSKTPARALAGQLEGISFACGHWHKVDQITRTDYHGKVHRGYSLPCLAKPGESHEFARVPNWQRGFATVDFDSDGTFALHTHLFENGKYLINGRAYK